MNSTVSFIVFHYWNVAYSLQSEGLYQTAGIYYWLIENRCQLDMLMYSLRHFQHFKLRIIVFEQGNKLYDTFCLQWVAFQYIIPPAVSCNKDLLSILSFSPADGFLIVIRKNLYFVNKTKRCWVLMRHTNCYEPYDIYERSRSTQKYWASRDISPWSSVYITRSTSFKFP